jgi:hypothetical protein
VRMQHRLVLSQLIRRFGPRQTRRLQLCSCGMARVSCTPGSLLAESHLDQPTLEGSSEQSRTNPTRSF